MCEYEIILIPVNIKCVHWALVTIEFNTKVCRYYDSLWTDGTEIMNNITNFFGIYLRNNPFYCINCEYEWIYCEENVSKQNNNYDCGVFVCKFMDLIARDEEIQLNEEDMEYYRAEIGVEMTKERIILID